MRIINTFKNKLSKKKKLAILFPIFVLILIGSGCYISQHLSATEEERFDHYTDQLFCQELSGNTLSLHYTLKNPARYNIATAPISLGSYQTDSASVSAAMENSLSRLHSYDKSKLSKEQQITYEILDFSLTASLKNSSYLLYEEPLAPLTGTQAQLPVLLSEYQFYKKQDIDTYLALLGEIPEYFASILTFEEEKAKQGLFMSLSQADAIIEECETFINLQENNYLYSSFSERIQSLDLSPKITDAYI